MQQWMCKIKLGKLISDYAAIYLTAGVESALVSIVQESVRVLTGTSSSFKSSTCLDAAFLEKVVAGSGELWGLMQPYAHLSSARFVDRQLRSTFNT